MRRNLRLSVLCAGLLSALPVLAVDSSAVLEIETRSYTQSNKTPDKFSGDLALSFEPEWSHGFNRGDTLLTFTPYGRWDLQDDNRDHFDIREANINHLSGNWEHLVGISRVFWGVAESNHLVDIINQTDLLEGIDGEDKLGQPMWRTSRYLNQGTFTAFILPGFREREFLSLDNPVAPSIPIDNTPVFQSSDGDDHVDYALRLSGYRGVLDYGLSWFRGTSREPEFMPGTDGRLVPFYPQIDQFGLDVQLTTGAWLGKLEVIRRVFDRSHTGSSEDFTALVGGFEYTLFGLNEEQFDLGLLLEHSHDGRDDRGTVFLQNDVFAGTRFGFNDVQSSEILAGAFYDLDDASTSLRVEANRRVFGDARISLEVQLFTNQAPGNLTFDQRNSDFVLLSLEHFF